MYKIFWFENLYYTNYRLLGGRDSKNPIKQIFYICGSVFFLVAMVTLLLYYISFSGGNYYFST